LCPRVNLFLGSGPGRLDRPGAVHHMVDAALTPSVAPSLAPPSVPPHPVHGGHGDDSKVFATGAADVRCQGAEVGGERILARWSAPGANGI